MKNLIALLSGLIFGIGLTVSQMVDPNKIIGFLSITTSKWDASLLFVMGGALLVFGVGFALWQRYRSAPVFESQFYLPLKQHVDRPLVIGAMLFGIGWGIGGLCPGPALANLLAGNEKIIVFVLMMSLGMWVGKKLSTTKIF
ncbi:YeeE/YedE family protein [Photobacterium lucens]|uniref:YeeE/YedE family protein n=1 Tax=Photobacterium lucens TaxID=2562949 RepID=UPI000D16E490|nr:YeeE/YedE family protein [Photobacterium lucens]MBP2699545.1 YeeE/YedE family protein [Vibrio parahaemolyticus]MZG55169.1 YeeE/YedE family protein [Photobacterium lucens]MZG82546.1 YeeE/YedE family protein [Photobacterium lucens]PSV20605.1 YeeE/YedE family protein [Photobacterium leiognathi subsp. mandapamensis]